MKINKANYIRGTLNLPGDKSISHRAAILSSLAEGITSIENFVLSADCASTLACLEALGVEISRDDSKVVIKGVGKIGLRKPQMPLDCGNSGTTMRLLSGVLAGQDFDSILVGDGSLQQRPMKRVIDPLRLMGAGIDADKDRAPLRISGKNPLRPLDYKLNIASAQIKSCIMLASLNASGKTSVIEPTPTRDHTERMLRWFGVEVTEANVRGAKKITVSGDANLIAKDLDVPADVSSAAFFITAAAFLEGSEITLPNVGVNPSRIAIIDVLRGFGADIKVTNRRALGNEPVGNLLVTGNKSVPKRPDSNLLSGPVIANLIDEIPILAVSGTQLDGGLEIRNASELRIKESDRISAIVENLKRMNAAVEEFEDGFRVGKSELKGAAIDSFGDHRIAMAFAVAGLLADGETEILGAECAAVSFPGFFDMLSSVIN